MTENDVAALLEFLMRDGGASGTSFDTIVCFGESSSVPHHDTGMRKLKFGDIILIDFGCKYNGYCSDCTRTFSFRRRRKERRIQEFIFKSFRSAYACQGTVESWNGRRRS